MKYKIEPNSVEETLIIPLYGRYIAQDVYPELKNNDYTKRIVESIDYDFASREKLMRSTAGLYGALECIQREYDLDCEIKEYLRKEPEASIVNLGAGLLDVFAENDNGKDRCYNIDLPNVIDVRNKLLPPRENEMNIVFDLNDFSWMETIDKSHGVIFVAAGVFYYFKREDMGKLLRGMSKEFKGSSLAFDTCNKLGLKMMLKTWIKEAGIKDVGAFFALSDPERELKEMGVEYENVNVRSYMHGYRKLKYSFIHSLLNILMDKIVKGRIVRIDF